MASEEEEAAAAVASLRPEEETQTNAASPDSLVVRLRGLPYSTNPQGVRDFFDGLKVRRDATRAASAQARTSTLSSNAGARARRAAEHRLLPLHRGWLTSREPADCRGRRVAAGQRRGRGLRALRAGRERGGRQGLRSQVHRGALHRGDDLHELGEAVSERAVQGRRPRQRRGRRGRHAQLPRRGPHARLAVDVDGGGRAQLLRRMLGA
eukprot:scaffold48_cov311-Pinguiococcus_pyrenoidosus.AAC.98